MAATTATAISLSTIVTPPSSSSSFSLLPSETTFTHFSPTTTNFPFPKTKPSLKTLSLKPQNFIHSPLPLLFPLHICHSSFASNETQHEQGSITTDELDEYPDDETEQEEQEEGVESKDFEFRDDDEEEEINDNKEGFESADDRRLFVGNLPYSMTPSELSEIFAQAGEVQFIEIIYDKVTDRSRGFGFVTMGSIDEAKVAIRMLDGSQVGGRTVRVNFPEVPRGGERKVMGPKIRNSNQSFVDTPHKLYAGNLGWSVTTQGLKDAFANKEGFLSAKVIYERESGRSRGFGFITFSSADAADAALNTMNGIELEGRPLRLNMASDRSRSNTEAYAEQSA